MLIYGGVGTNLLVPLLYSPGGDDPNRSDELAHAIFYMREFELKDIPILIPIDKRFNITISPTSVKEQDLIELGTTNGSRRLC